MSTATRNRCAQCDAPLADDQRYCLQCGARRNGARLPFNELARPAPAGAAPPPPPPDRPAPGITAGMAAAGVAIAVLFLGVGVLVGRAGSDNATQTAAAKPTIVRVGGDAAPTVGGTTKQASNTTVKSDWPSGNEGWTVQLQQLPRDDAAKVAAAKKAAQDKGAPEVGLLDTDEFESLPPGNFVVYSGQFDTKAKATAALGKLKKDFPNAKVLHVGGAAPAITGVKAEQNKQAIQNLENLQGSDYAKQSRKLPDELAVPGKPPPKDNKEGGGGSGFETID